MGGAEGGELKTASVVAPGREKAAFQWKAARAVA